MCAAALVALTANAWAHVEASGDPEATNASPRIVVGALLVVAIVAAFVQRRRESSRT